MACRIQKISIYESKEAFYVVGATSSHGYRWLTIDRQDPNVLSFRPDIHEYSRQEITRLLSDVKVANEAKMKHGGTGKGLFQRESAFGVIGFIRFLEGYYLVLVKNRRKVALLGGHSVYKIIDTRLIYIPSQSLVHPEEEKRYMKIFETVDLSGNFYFSYTYDLTNSMQFNMAKPPAGSHGSMDDHQIPVPPPFGPLFRPEWKFVWNRHLLVPQLHRDWRLPIVHGFIGQARICLAGHSIFLTLIGRRSSYFAGTRYMKRGVNNEGDVANEVETEQILSNSYHLCPSRGRYSSFVQVRGSVPLIWYQELTTLTRPPIEFQHEDLFYSLTAMHFRKLFERYGSGIHVLSLLKAKDLHDENRLNARFEAAVAYLNQFLPPAYRIHFTLIDMAAMHKQKEKRSAEDSETERLVIKLLSDKGSELLAKVGFYANFPSLRLRSDAGLARSVGGLKMESQCLQTGVIRTNCVDCLDRTNTAQLLIGKQALQLQLRTMGLCERQSQEFETPCMQQLSDLYTDHGDTLSLQYGSSNLVHNIDGYRKTAPKTQATVDILQGVQRYLKNRFTDEDKQNAINLFLGLFVPSSVGTSGIQLWDLPNDHSLHWRPLNRVRCRLYTDWLDRSVTETFPLPTELVQKWRTLHNSVEPVYTVSNLFDELFQPNVVQQFAHFFPIQLTEDRIKALQRFPSADDPFRPAVEKQLKAKQKGFLSWLFSVGSPSQMFVSSGESTNGPSPLDDLTPTDIDLFDEASDCPSSEQAYGLSITDNTGHRGCAVTAEYSRFHELTSTSRNYDYRTLESMLRPSDDLPTEHSWGSSIDVPVPEVSSKSAYAFEQFFIVDTRAEDCTDELKLMQFNSYLRGDVF